MKDYDNGILMFDAALANLNLFPTEMRAETSIDYAEITSWWDDYRKFTPSSINVELTMKLVGDPDAIRALVDRFRIDI